MIHQNEFGCKCNRNDFHALQRNIYKINLRVLIEKCLFDEHLLSHNGSRIHTAVRLGKLQYNPCDLIPEHRQQKRAVMR